MTNEREASKPHKQMSEIQKGSSQTVYLDLYSENADALPTVTVQKGDGTTTSLVVTNEGPVGNITERYSTILGLANTQNEDSLKVTWSLSIGGTPVTKTEYYDIVTNYVSVSEVKAIWPHLSDDQAVDLESNVRRIIDAYCGQNFGGSTKTLTVNGAGEDFLRLPERLLVLQGIQTLTTTLDIKDSIITGDGWYLKKGWTAGNVYTTSDNQYFTNVDDFWINNPDVGEPGYEKPEHGYVIHAPRQYAMTTPWMKDYPFKITGSWGWVRVPVDVSLAAKLLINDYGCNEELYRDRYLKAVKFADTDIDFGQPSWGGTGNVRADQLLSEFVIADWALL